MQRIANQSLRDGLHSYERRHGWKGNLPNVLRDNLGKLETYEDEDWRRVIEKGTLRYRTCRFGSDKDAVIKIGPTAEFSLPTNSPGPAARNLAIS